MTSRLHKITTSVLLGSPALICLVFIAVYGVNVVFQDQWSFVPIFEKLYSGTLDFSDLIAQHNEHRYLIYRIILIFPGSITRWNNLAEMYLSWFLLCCICFTLYKIYTSSTGSSWSAAAKFIPVPWVIFNPVSYTHLRAHET